ncbi:hypothetical protein K9O30_15055 [Clostridium bowmanii]|uniref:hypothetical protein n=1 Tax=Clostridium bowmanii TaxID=132925 RepID=UPI001C0C13D2|nr:hypothetical protein [Clostridium bowmanii]MBU3190738.1 hypothetical protein [Clostridium bowmanii]MCA1075016.1 hypothetical protein [Clostridium bowmanii]
MIANEVFDIIMNKNRISNVLLSKVTSIHTTTISRYRNDQRNFGKQNFNKIYDALIELKVSKKTMKELRMEYENPRVKKVL